MRAVFNLLVTDDEKEGGSVVAAIALAAACHPHTPQALIVGVSRDEGEDRISHPLTVARTPCLRGFGSAYMPKLSRVLDAHRDQIGMLHVHGAWSFANVQAMRWAHRHDVPVIWTAHNQVNATYLASKALKKRLFLRAALPQFRRAVRCIRAITVREQAELGALGLPCESVVVPNGVDVPASAVRSRDALAAKIGELEGKRVLLFVGRISPEKGVPELLEAFSACQESCPDWVLVVAGSPVGSSAPWLTSVMDKMTSESRVHYLGHWPMGQIGELYQAADCLVLPSHSEVRSLVVLEASAHAVPSVITEECDFAELYEAGGGFLARRASLQADLVRALRTPTDELACMGQVARDLVERTYSWSQVGKQMSDVYRRYLPA